jgi:hypothetical protein
MHSAHLLDVKQRVLQSDVATIGPLVARMLRTHDRDRLRNLLQRLNA